MCQASSQSWIDRQPRAAQPIVSSVPQFHLDDLFAAGNKISILVENSRDNRQFIVAAPRRFPEANPFDVQVRQDRQARPRFIFLEKLSLQIDRQVPDLLLRE